MAADSKWIFQNRIYRIDRINSSCESCYPVNIYMARLPKAIADLYHLNSSLKPIETEPGRIWLKMGRRKGEARKKGTADERRFIVSELP